MHSAKRIGKTDICAARRQGNHQYGTGHKNQTHKQRTVVTSDQSVAPVTDVVGEANQRGRVSQAAASIMQLVATVAGTSVAFGVELGAAINLHRL